MESLSDQLYLSMQWSLDVKDSSIANAGKGVFLKGHVRPGTFLVCFNLSSSPFFMFRLFFLELFIFVNILLM